MEIATLQVIITSISATAITGSLIYSAIQFREWRRATYVANFSKLVELQMELRKMRVDDPSLAQVYKHDVASLTSDREIREYFMNIMQLSLFEIAWFSHQHGQLPDDYFQSWERSMETIKGEASFRAMMENKAMKILHDDFRRYINERMKPESDGAPPKS